MATMGELLPTTLSRPPTAWFPVMELRQQVVQLEQQVAEYHKLEAKLAVITDEPVQNAMVRSRQDLSRARVHRVVVLVFFFLPEGVGETCRDCWSCELLTGLAR